MAPSWISRCCGGPSVSAPAEVTSRSMARYSDDAALRTAPSGGVNSAKASKRLDSARVSEGAPGSTASCLSGADSDAGGDTPSLAAGTTGERAPATAGLATLDENEQLRNSSTIRQGQTEGQEGPGVAQARGEVVGPGGSSPGAGVHVAASSAVVLGPDETWARHLLRQLERSAASSAAGDAKLNGTAAGVPPPPAKATAALATASSVAAPQSTAPVQSRSTDPLQRRNSTGTEPLLYSLIEQHDSLLGAPPLLPPTASAPTAAAFSKAPTRETTSTTAVDASGSSPVVAHNVSFAVPEEGRHAGKQRKPLVRQVTPHPVRNTRRMSMDAGLVNAHLQQRLVAALSVHEDLRNQQLGQQPESQQTPVLTASSTQTTQPSHQVPVATVAGDVAHGRIQTEGQLRAVAIARRMEELRAAFGSPGRARAALRQPLPNVRFAANTTATAATDAATAIAASPAATIAAAAFDTAVTSPSTMTSMQAPAAAAAAAHDKCHSAHGDPDATATMASPFDGLRATGAAASIMDGSHGSTSVGHGEEDAMVGRKSSRKLRVNFSFDGHPASVAAARISLSGGTSVRLPPAGVTDVGVAHAGTALAAPASASYVNRRASLDAGLTAHAAGAAGGRGSDTTLPFAPEPPVVPEEGEGDEAEAECRSTQQPPHALHAPQQQQPAHEHPHTAEDALPLGMAPEACGGPALAEIATAEVATELLAEAVANVAVGLPVPDLSCTDLWALQPVVLTKCRAKLLARSPTPLRLQDHGSGGSGSGGASNSGFGAGGGVSGAGRPSRRHSIDSPLAAGGSSRTSSSRLVRGVADTLTEGAGALRRMLRFGSTASAGSGSGADGAFSPTRGGGGGGGGGNGPAGWLSRLSRGHTGFGFGGSSNHEGSNRSAATTAAASGTESAGEDVGERKTRHSAPAAMPTAAATAIAAMASPTAAAAASPFSVGAAAAVQQQQQQCSRLPVAAAAGTLKRGAIKLGQKSRSEMLPAAGAETTGTADQNQQQHGDLVRCSHNVPHHASHVHFPDEEEVEQLQGDGADVKRLGPLNGAELRKKLSKSILLGAAMSSSAHNIGTYASAAAAGTATVVGSDAIGDIRNNGMMVSADTAAAWTGDTTATPPHDGDAATDGSNPGATSLPDTTAISTAPHFAPHAAACCVAIPQAPGLTIPDLSGTDLWALQPKAITRCRAKLLSRQLTPRHIGSGANPAFGSGTTGDSASGPSTPVASSAVTAAGAAGERESNGGGGGRRKRRVSGEAGGGGGGVGTRLVQDGAGALKRIFLRQSSPGHTRQAAAPAAGNTSRSSRPASPPARAMLGRGSGTGTPPGGVSPKAGAAATAAEVIPEAAAATATATGNAAAAPATATVAPPAAARANSGSLMAVARCTGDPAAAATAVVAVAEGNGRVIRGGGSDSNVHLSASAGDKHNGTHGTAAVLSASAGDKHNGTHGTAAAPAAPATTATPAAGCSASHPLFARQSSSNNSAGQPMFARLSSSNQQPGQPVFPRQSSSSNNPSGQPPVFERNSNPATTPSYAEVVKAKAAVKAVVTAAAAATAATASTSASNPGAGGV